MIARNTLLRGRPDHFSDAALRETLGNNMSPVLELRVRKARIAKDISLRKWIQEVKLEDDFMTRERELTRGTDRTQGVASSSTYQICETNVDFVHTSVCIKSTAFVPP